MIRLALYQPDIPQNLGTIMRLSTCMGVELSIIEPCSFIFNEKKMLRAGMDYIERANYIRHKSWDHFLEWKENLKNANLVLFTTKTDCFFHEHIYNENDILLFGRESAGVPGEVVEHADYSVKIPMSANERSLNIAVSASMGLSEALRQIGQFPAGV